MVKYTRYYKKYNRVSKRQFNYIARNYLKYKVRASYQVKIDQNLMAGDFSITFQNILEKAPDYALLAKQFLQYKITGAVLDVSPIVADGTNVANCRFTVSIMSTADDSNFNAVSQSPNALNLGTEHCRKYVKINSAWVSTSEIGLPSMRVITQMSGAPTSGMITFNYVITLYLMFKTPA